MFFKKKGKSTSPPRSGKRASTPRYSRSTAGTQTWKYSGSRYSQSSAGGLYRNIKISPTRSGLRYVRYSKLISLKSARYQETPRYSKPVNWKNFYQTEILSSSSSKHRFDVNERYKQLTRPYTPWLDDYAGNVKYKKTRHKNMHPGVNYYSTKNIGSKNIKKALRKWNVFWVQLNPRKINPKGLRNVVKKPKFDKREKDIWNNRRDRKPTTRNIGSSGAEEADSSDQKDKNNQ